MAIGRRSRQLVATEARITNLRRTEDGCIETRIFKFAVRSRLFQQAQKSKPGTKTEIGSVQFRMGLSAMNLIMTLAKSWPACSWTK